MANTVVEIDTGTFKYVLVEAVSPAGEQCHLVRGFIGCEYHADVLEKAMPAITAAGYTGVRCTGGGRMRHDGGQKLFIYGYSQAYGPGDHATTARLCRERYPGLSVEWSNDGY